MKFKGAVLIIIKPNMDSFQVPECYGSGLNR
jgi:hypothetical protein